MTHGGMTLRAAKLAVAVVTGILLVALAPVAADASSAEVIYKNIPNSKIGLPALGFQSDSVSEFGGAVKFGGTDRTSPTVAPTTMPRVPSVPARNFARSTPFSGSRCSIE